VIKIGPYEFIYNNQRLITRTTGEAMTPAPGATSVVIDFRSHPPGAQVTVVSDGVRTKLGTTPIMARLDRGAVYHIAVSKAGYAIWTALVRFEGPGSITVSATLQPMRQKHGCGEREKSAE